MSESKSISVALLYRKFQGEALSEREERDFDTWYNKSEEHQLYYKRFCAQQERIMTRERSVVNVPERLAEVRRRARGGRRGRRVYWWSGVAAAVMVLVSIGWLLTEDVKVPEVARVMPGKAAVILQLGEGKRIVLDSTLATRTIGRDSVAIQVGAGMLAYRQDSVATGELVYNELVVPLAGEYMVVLADGTKVYLNSGSRLRYPTVFPADERRVELSGEGYFVVAKGERPFIVETGLEEVKVFGTEFNVMAYEDERVSQTTLVKGSVGVLVKGSGAEGFRKMVPGEQFLLNRETRQAEVVPVDVFAYVAWKDGMFVSRNDDLETILRKVARWFDVEVFFRDPGLKGKRFYGIMKRQTSLQEVLDVIAEAGDVRFEVNGRTVVVNGK